MDRQIHEHKEAKKRISQKRKQKKKQIEELQKKQRLLSEVMES
jgi:hypothetical protein